MSPRPKSRPSPNADPQELPVPRFVLESKHPHRTCWLVVHYRTGDDFLALVTKELTPLGWRPEPFPPLPALLGVEERTFENPGTDLFNGWTAGEAGAKQGGVRAVSLRLNVPLYRRRLTLEDML